MKQPVNPFHPGEILLEEFLQPLGMTQTAFAERRRADLAHASTGARRPGGAHTFAPENTT